MGPEATPFDCTMAPGSFRRCYGADQICSGPGYRLYSKGDAKYLSGSQVQPVLQSLSCVLVLSYVPVLQTLEE